MRLPPSVLALALWAISVPAFAEIGVDFAKVSVDKRGGVEWCVLDSQVTGTFAGTRERLVAVLEDYAAYPRLFPKIKQASVQRDAGAVLLSEVVVIEAVGIVNTNRFVLRIFPAEQSARSYRLVWSQESTDGTIDSLEGGWLLQDVGTTQEPRVKVVYRTKSAVPVRMPGQDVVIGMFLGAETKSVVEAVFKEALSR